MATTRRATSKPTRARPVTAVRRSAVVRIANGVVKRSVSLDADLDDELTRRFGPGERSRFLNAAARDALARILVVELLAQFDQEDGPVPEAVHDQVATLPRPQ